MSKTFYSLDNGAFTEGNTIVVAEEGVHEIRYYSMNHAGNQEGIKTAVVKIDLAGPLIVPTVSMNVYWTEGGSLQFDISDPVSGVASESLELNGNKVSLPYTFSPLSLPIGEHMLKVQAVDTAGNDTTATYLLNIQMDVNHLDKAVLYASQQGWITHQDILSSLLSSIERIQQITDEEQLQIEWKGLENLVRDQNGHTIDTRFAGLMLYAIAQLTSTTLGEAPDAPTGFAVAHSYFDAVSLTWDWSVNARSYVVMRDNKQVYEGTASAFRDQTVTASTYYDYMLYAKNEYGLSAGVSLNQVYTSAAPTIATTPPVSSVGQVGFQFEVIEGIHEYHINRNPHWKYSLNPDGTYQITYDNAATGEIKDLGRVSVTNGKLPFLENGLAAGSYTYQLTAVIKNPDGTDSVTPPIVVTGQVDRGIDTSTGDSDNEGGSSEGNPDGSVPPEKGNPGAGDNGGVTGVTPGEGNKDDDKKETIAFSDIKGHWAESQIISLVAKGIVDGYEDGTFAPDRKVTRAEFTSMVVRALNLQGEAASDSFQDVGKNDWFYNHVQMALKHKLVEGSSDNRFNPNDLITRQEMAAIVGRALAASGKLKMDFEAAKILSAFEDASGIADWARDYMAALVNANIIMGAADQQLQPLKEGTRAELATLLCRVLDFMKIDM
ncbi:Endo-1,4-beta-xylanase A precursor [compost metagenome]